MLTSLYPRWPRWPVWNGPYPPPEGTPVNSTAPYIGGPDGGYGPYDVGTTLTCTMGNWTGEPLFYFYQWMRNGEYLIYAHTSSYTLTDEDAGTKIKCELVAENSIGPSMVEAYSNEVDVNGGVKIAPPETVKSEF